MSYSSYDKANDFAARARARFAELNDPEEPVIRPRYRRSFTLAGAAFAAAALSFWVCPGALMGIDEVAMSAVPSAMLALIAIGLVRAAHAVVDPRLFGETAGEI